MNDEREMFLSRGAFQIRIKVRTTDQPASRAFILLLRRCLQKATISKKRGCYKGSQHNSMHFGALLDMWLFSFAHTCSNYRAFHTKNMILPIEFTAQLIDFY